MNPLQQFIIEQIARYDLALSAGEITKLDRVILFMQEHNKPQDIPAIRVKLAAYSEHISNIYCRLLLASIEGEALKLVREHPDSLPGWELPQVSPLVHNLNQMEIGDLK
jgi:hypothetical protein